MKIIYVSKYSSFIKTILKWINLKIEFIDDSYPFKGINYTSDKDYVERTDNLKNDLSTLIYVIKKYLKNVNNDLIEPDYAIERGYVNNLQEIIDKDHILNFIYDNKDIKIIVVRQLRDFFIFKRFIYKKKLKIKILYIPSIQSIIAFFKQNKPTFFVFL